MDTSMLMWANMGLHFKCKLGFYWTIHNRRVLTWHNNCLDSWLSIWCWLTWRRWSTISFRGEGERLCRCDRFAFIQFGKRVIAVSLLGRRFRFLIGNRWILLFVDERISCERIPCAFHWVWGVSGVFSRIWTGIWSKNLKEKLQVTDLIQL